MIVKCKGNDAAAKEAFKAFIDEYGKRELEMERYYDHTMAANALSCIFNSKLEFEQ